MLKWKRDEKDIDVSVFFSDDLFLCRYPIVSSDLRCIFNRIGNSISDKSIPRD